MKLKDVIQKLEANSAFKEWRKKNKSYYLAHAFMMMDKANANMWQIGYYDKEKDKVTTFIIEGDNIKISPELNIFKRPDATVEKLDVSKVKIGTIQAIETAEKAVNVAENTGMKDLAEKIRKRLELYQAGQPYFEN